MRLLYLRGGWIEEGKAWREVEGIRDYYNSLEKEWKLCPFEEREEEDARGVDGERLAHQGAWMMREKKGMSLLRCQDRQQQQNIRNGMKWNAFILETLKLGKT